MQQVLSCFVETLLFLVFGEGRKKCLHKQAGAHTEFIFDSQGFGPPSTQPSCFLSEYFIIGAGFPNVMMSQWCCCFVGGFLGLF